ncbi:hypothetical protein IFM89_011293 [Coptis chinensis]|uniref:Peptidase C45 hydrolase domain-containing protein n=1 Tax=Coptis chinensis TaxID=261450 RepID=A0A835HUC9_9MAGN|nr:hypothetical protein IFM89_011293 [Coptis chinensis]
MKMGTENGDNTKLMESSNKEKLETFEVGPCEEAYEMGFLIGQRFSHLIKSGLATDLTLLPFAQSPQSQPLIRFESNSKKYPRYWDELSATAEGSAVPVLNNFWKEILPFLPKKEPTTHTDTSDDCSDILVVTDLPMSLWLGTRNALIHSHFDLCKETEVTLLLHIYLIKARLPSGLSFTTYTYAGELPSCAFGFNSNGLAFTLNSVPPTEEEIMVGGIGRNFVSRDLLEAITLDDSLSRIHSAEASVGHSYNLIDMKTRKLLNVETASRKRMSVLSVGSTPFSMQTCISTFKCSRIEVKSSPSGQHGHYETSVGQ